MNANQTNRIFSLDVLRLIAILAVIMIHCCGEYDWRGSCLCFSFFLGVLLHGISKFAVPFFIMISGALMLDENKNIPIYKLKNKIIKLVCLLIVWSAFYTIFKQIIIPLFILHIPINIKSVFCTFIGGYYHLWYLYMVIGLYLLTPVLRLFIKEKYENYIYYIIILSIFFQFLPESFFKFNTLNTAISKFSLNFVCGYWIYYILGWSIINLWHKYIDKYQKIIYFCGFCSLVIICISRYFFMNEIFFNNFSIFVFFYSLAFFIFCKDFSEKNKFLNKIQNIITYLAKLSFGVYLVHIFILYIVKQVVKIIFGMDYTNGNALLYLVIIYFSTFIVSFIIAHLMYKNNLLKKCITI